MTEETKHASIVPRLDNSPAAEVQATAIPPLPAKETEKPPQGNKITARLRNLWADIVQRKKTGVRTSEFCNAARKFGFAIEYGQGKAKDGSHMKFFHKATNKTMTVVNHNGRIDPAAVMQMNKFLVDNGLLGKTTA
jgi:predicted RNA binding protein YcfA (HicA-like mRNA interferase family)